MGSPGLLVLLGLVGSAAGQDDSAPFVGAAPNGRDLLIAAAQGNVAVQAEVLTVNGMDLLGTLDTYGRTIQTNHEQITSAVAEVNTSASAATASLRQEMVVMLSQLNATLTARIDSQQARIDSQQLVIDAQSSTIASQNTTIVNQNATIVNLTGRVGEVEVEAEAASASGGENYLSFEWGQHCLVREGTLNGTNTTATVCDCSFDVNSDEKLSALYGVIRNCTVVTGDLVLEHIEGSNDDIGDEADIFANIVAVGGHLIVRKSPYLTEPLPFTALTTVGGDCRIEEMGFGGNDPTPGLGTMDGMFPALTGVGEILSIIQCLWLRGDFLGTSFQNLVHTGAVRFSRVGGTTGASTNSACNTLKGPLCGTTLYLKSDSHAQSCCPTSYRYFFPGQNYDERHPDSGEHADYGWFSQNVQGDAHQCCRSYCSDNGGTMSCPN